MRGASSTPPDLEEGPGKSLPVWGLPKPFSGSRESAMNYLRTAFLLAGLAGLFMGVGYLIGGSSGALIALLIAAATNLFTYWNSDRMVLSLYGAHEVNRAAAPELYDLVAELASRAG